MRTRGDVNNEAAVESPVHEESFWGSNTDAKQQDWVGYLGLDAADDETSVPGETVMTEEPVELTSAPVTAAVHSPDAFASLTSPDAFASLTAPNDDLLPHR